MSESLLVLPLSSSHSKLEVPDLKFTSLSWKYQEPGSCTSLDFLSILVRSRYSHSRGWALGTKPCFGLLQLLCCPMGLTKNHDCFSSSEIQFCLLLHDERYKVQQLIIYCRGSVSTCLHCWAPKISPLLQVSKLFIEITSYPLAYILMRHYSVYYFLLTKSN